MKQQALISNDELDVMRTVLELREQRMGVVQSGDQYKVFYLFVLFICFYLFLFVFIFI